jgi:tetratricopeptide (TPR) repeat protein
MGLASGGRAGLEQLLARADSACEERRPAAAETLARRALAELGSDGGLDGPTAARLRVRALCVLGCALRDQGRYRDAEEPLRAALALAERFGGVGELAVAQAANDLAVLCKYTARFEEAETLYRQALRLLQDRRGAEDLEATLWHNLGGLEHSRGRFELAEPAARRAVEIRSRTLGSDHPALAADQAALAAILDALGRSEEAEVLFRQAIDAFTRRYGPRHYEVAPNLNNLAAVRFRLGDVDEARLLWERALELKRELLGERHPEVASTLVNLGVLASTLGDEDRARSLFEQALELLGSDVGRDHPVYRAATRSLAKLEATDGPLVEHTAPAPPAGSG